jgi:large subunit ribosomal protein L31
VKEGIHPKYQEVEARCACGATWKTKSTKPELHLEICNNCHPFFTGRQKLIDTEGRVERFTKRFGAQTVESRKAAQAAQKAKKPAAATKSARTIGRGLAAAARPGSLLAPSRRRQPADPRREHEPLS